MRNTLDILKDLHEGGINAAEVYALADETEPFEIHSSWGLSKSEWTAYCQGAGWEDLAKWRYNSWPSVCCVCGRPLPSPPEFGWFVTESGDGTVLRHIRCRKSQD